MKLEKQFQTIGLCPHHGISISLSSLRSSKSSGIGEFLDLLPLIDWCKTIGLDVIQLMPLNDTGSDQSPYNALSSCALDPVHLSLWALPEFTFPAQDLDPFIALTKTNRVQPNAVKHEKIRLLTRYYQEQFPKVASRDAYKRFLKNSPWLESYALFKVYKEEQSGKFWRSWPLEMQRPTQKGLKENQLKVHFHCFLQYLCHEQLLQVKKYADQNQIFLKGDLPILVSPDSADVWAEPHLFDQTLVAGAPPDFYNPKGQKWGFPLYNWDAMKKENYAWWKRRLATLSDHFHIYRIDHIVGFFRIWAIPLDSLAAQGHFIPKDPNLWAEHGTHILEMMIAATPLLPMAEDLGTIPPFVPHILKELGICGTKVLRWEHLPINEYEPLSLTTVSTHDSETLTLWWQNFPDEAIRFCHLHHIPYTPHLTSETLYKILHLSHHSSSLFHINLLQETLALFPELVWPDPNDERINIPGTVLPTNWTYRYRPTLEEMIDHPELSNTFKRLIS